MRRRLGSLGHQDYRKLIIEYAPIMRSLQRQAHGRLSCMSLHNSGVLPKQKLTFSLAKESSPCTFVSFPGPHWSLSDSPLWDPQLLVKQTGNCPWKSVLEESSWSPLDPSLFSLLSNNPDGKAELSGETRDWSAKFICSYRQSPYPPRDTKMVSKGANRETAIVVLLNWIKTDSAQSLHIEDGTF